MRYSRTTNRARLLSVLGLVVAMGASAQLTIDSPYSAFGIGAYESFGSAAFQGMGNARLAVYDSMLVNISNPASYPSIAAHRPAFNIGVNGNTTWLGNANGESSYSTGFTLYESAIGIPFAKRFGAGVGIVPFSRVGYDFQTSDVVNGTDSVEYSYQGNGGLFRSFLAFSGAILNNKTHFLSLGAELDFFFGTNTSQRDARIINDPDAYVARVQNRRRVSDFGALFGLAYRYSLRDSANGTRALFSLGATYSPQWHLSGVQEFYSYNFIDIASTEAPVDSTEVIDTLVGQVNYPQRFSVGVATDILAGRSSRLKWRLRLAFDMEYVQYSTYSETFQGAGFVADNYRNRTSYSFGAEFTPHAPPPGEAVRSLSRTNYFSLMRYRVGFQFTNTELVIDDQPLDRVQLHWGLGFPLGLPRNHSNLNFGMAFGKHATTDAGLLEEKYMAFYLGLTLSPFGDQWFRKRRYD